ncbi:P-loop containing nucleoside triphosphate hydrolase protein [Amylocarpus encephaloides]|uniref:P-loop containing nucleoside triphosphate hydrolase protein n=1 Tax=Amylocarpus encephaloides TaxID=45428 RepID=A0A9P7YV36_9HELO|nr:P-loop containing nucleoside triphosphate hydrolase protein [Amylocarpus encephaloides]
MTCTKETVKASGLNIWSDEAAGRPAPRVDIIAVQGLGSHEFYTWVKKGSLKANKPKRLRDKARFWKGKRAAVRDQEDNIEVMWIRDLLVPGFQDARIATYSYKSDWRDRTIKTNLRECANLFLNELLQHRQKENERQRPIVLIGHSLGCVVIQKALVIAASSRHFREIGLSVAGIIFLGGPFQGSDAALWGTWLAQVLRSERSLLELLQKDSQPLFDIGRDFAECLIDWDVIYFYETQNATYGPLTFQTVNQQSATQLGKRMIPLDTDHSGLNKFSGEDDVNFKRVLPEIRRMVEGGGLIVTERYRAIGERSPKSTVPISRDNKFVDRQDVFKALDIQFSHSDCHNRAVLTGLGGVGKSQIAIEHSYRLRERDPNLWVFWVYASTAERFENAYKSIAATLDLPGADDPKTDVLDLVSRWLSNPDHGRWHMILDNADDIRVFQKTQGEGSATGDGPNLPLLDYIPQSTNGSVLVTTRDRGVASWLASGYRDAIPVNLMTVEEADQLLCARIPEGLSTEFHRAELVEELDYLPLAISQAAAYISAKVVRMTVSKYLRLYRQNEESQSRLLDEDTGDLRRHPSVPNSVIRTWQISFDQLKRNKPQAAELLSLMAMLDRQGIPEFLLNVQYPSLLDLEDALGSLHEFSLITIEKGGKTFGMHRLVQLATRKWVEKYGDNKRWWGEAIKVVSKAFPDGSYSNWKTCETLSPHALQVLAYRLESRKSMLDRASLLHNMAWYNWIQGRYEVANAESQESLAIREQYLQYDDGTILASRSMLASVLSSQGKYADAEALNRQTLAIREEVLGKTHPSTLTTMSNLADVLSSQGKYAGAEVLNRQTLAIREEVLGKTHPSTLTTMSNLADVLSTRASTRTPRR